MVFTLWKSSSNSSSYNRTQVIQSTSNMKASATVSSQIKLHHTPALLVAVFLPCLVIIGWVRKIWQIKKNIANNTNHNKVYLTTKTVLLAFSCVPSTYILQCRRYTGELYLLLAFILQVMQSPGFKIGMNETALGTGVPYWIKGWTVVVKVFWLAFLFFYFLGFLTFYSPGSDGEDGGAASGRAGLPAEHPLWSRVCPQGLSSNQQTLRHLRPNC